MRFKKPIALILACIVVLSSVGLCASLFFIEQSSNHVAQTDSIVKLVAYSGHSAYEFREGFNLSHTPQTKTDSGNFLYVASLWAINRIVYTRYNFYSHKQFSQRASLKLFLDFRSLII